MVVACKYTLHYSTMQYFDLSKGAVGTYGYEWVDYDDDGRNGSKRCLELNVTRYNGGRINPTNKTFTVNGNTTISKKGGGRRGIVKFSGTLMF